MHETVIAKNIVNESIKHGDVKEIYLEIGELAHVPSNELVDCLRSMVDWKVNYKERFAKVQCSCGYKGHPTILERGHDHFLIECPKCEETPDLIDGTEIKILRVVVK